MMIEVLKGKKYSYYKPSKIERINAYISAMPKLLILETPRRAENEKSKKHLEAKIGELEEDNISLRRELDAIKGQLKLLTEMLTKKQSS